MFDIGFFELLLIAGLGLIILGPERLPKAARTVGMYIGRIRRQMSNIQQDIERQIREEDLREKLKDPFTRFEDEDSQSIHPPAADAEQTPEKHMAQDTEHFIKPGSNDKNPS